MQVIFLDAPYSGTVELCKETLEHLSQKKYSTVGLYASVQFVNQLEKVKQKLKDNKIEIITSKADRTHVQGQLLGCDNYHNSLNVSPEELAKIDCFLYIGDGRFHPLALVYAQKDLPKELVKEIVCNDPLAKKINIVSFNDIKGILRKYRASLIKFISCGNIGLLHTIKPGQEQFKASLALEKKYPNKKCYHFIDNVISFDQLENFPFIEVWVNTTCPRVGFDDQEKFEKGIINLNDALSAEKILAGENYLNSLQSPDEDPPG